MHTRGSWKKERGKNYRPKGILNILVCGPSLLILVNASKALGRMGGVGGSLPNWGWVEGYKTNNSKTKQKKPTGRKGKEMRMYLWWRSARRDSLPSIGHWGVWMGGVLLPCWKYLKIKGPSWGPSKSRNERALDRTPVLEPSSVIQCLQPAFLGTLCSVHPLYVCSSRKQNVQVAFCVWYMHS